MSPSLVHTLLKLEKWHPLKTYLSWRVERQISAEYYWWSPCSKNFNYKQLKILFKGKFLNRYGKSSYNTHKWWVIGLIVRSTRYTQFLLFDGFSTRQRYLQFSQEYLIPIIVVLFLYENNCEILKYMWYPKDISTPHHELAVRRFLDEVFPNRLTGTSGRI